MSKETPVVIFAGGLGTRISEETELKPKPLISVAGVPIIFQVMEIYSRQGYNNFILCLGYKADEIKAWFLNYSQTKNDFQLDLTSGELKIISKTSQNWTITFIDTGVATNTAGRLRRVERYINSQVFLLTYADGLGNIDISKLLARHKQTAGLVTMTTTRASGRFGYAQIENGQVVQFDEKTIANNLQINSGFFVVDKKVFDLYSMENEESWEVGVLENLAKANLLFAYEHKGFWKPMDTLRDKRELDELGQLKIAPWFDKLY